MPPAELENWLMTGESKSVGNSDDQESKGHRSGRRIVKIKRTNKDELTEKKWNHMVKAIEYIKRHCAKKALKRILRVGHSGIHS